MARVLVTDGDQRSALAIVRSLGNAGHQVFVCGPREQALAGRSRHTTEYGRTSSPLETPDRFAEEVGGLCARWRVNVLIPVTEASLLALLPHRGELAPARIPFPDLDAFRRVADKEYVLSSASELGIAVPKQWVVGCGEAELPQDLEYPLVLKPARSVGEADGARVKVGVSYVSGRTELEGRLADLSPAAFPVLLQRRVEGPGVGIFLLLWDGRPVAVFSHRRLREKPPSGGVSVYCESIPADPALVSSSRDLLERLDWWGVAMVEYKIEAATGTPYLMEINGRFWGSLQLAVDAGVDFPRLLVDCALGGNPDPVHSYCIDVRNRWWWGDFDHLLARLRRSAEELALPPGAPSRGRVLRDFLRLWRPGDRSEVFRLNDPSPGVQETLDWVRRR